VLTSLSAAGSAVEVASALLGGAHYQAVAYDGFRYFPDSSTITGSWALYGLRDA
jgi:hypothetical protein